MTKPGTHQALNRLLTIVYRSLPMYLTYACPWTHRGDEQAVVTLRRIVDEQKAMANRIAQHILEHHETIEAGEYPIDFPDTHDLSLDYLLKKLALCQKDDVAELERTAADLAGDRQAAALAADALQAARTQLEALEELAGEPTK